MQGAAEIVGRAAELPDPKLRFGLENLPVTDSDRLCYNRDFMTMQRIGVMQEFPHGDKRSAAHTRVQSEAVAERAGFVRERAVAENVKLPPGTSISWSGQFEYLERAKARLAVLVPFALLIIFMLLYLTFNQLSEALLIMASLPFALIGGFWLMWWLGHNLSVATAVGFIALAGVAAEFGVIMLIYLRHAIDRRIANGAVLTRETLLEAIHEDAVLRVRPKAMTVILAGLAPLMWSEGTGAEVMQRIAAPMIGGMVSAPLLSMIVIPAAYYLMRRPTAVRQSQLSSLTPAAIGETL